MESLKNRQDIFIFGYEKWFQDGKLILSKKPMKEQDAIYRGWMMKPEQYGSFYHALIKQGIHLVTPPEDYRLMHLFPNVHALFGEDAAGMALYPLHAQIDIEEVKRKFSRFMVKDYVKSVKGTDFPACFDRNVTQEDFDRWMDVFYQYRGDLLTGGICIKEYLDLKRYGDRTNEWRAFYISHTAATVRKNSGQPDYAPHVPQELVDKYRHLDSIYYTVDMQSSRTAHGR